jgi:uncharacterized protein YjbI with pentapeptide repeats
MAHPDHLAILSRGVEIWNQWRQEHTDQMPDLGKAYLHEAHLSGANLRKADLHEAHLIGANLRRADLRIVNLGNAYLQEADLGEADLSAADLSGANLYGANLREADLTVANLRRADLTWANLGRACLTRADLIGADLRSANLSEADLSGAWLVKVDLRWANLRAANLRAARLNFAVAVKTDFAGADLTGCHIYGIAAWDVNLEEAIQKKLVITEEEPHVQVDDLEVAQFIYLLLNRRKLRNVITTLGERAVLILGRFTERKELLDALADKLRALGYLPMIFDFERPTDRDLTETVKVLAGLALFVIADITNPRSVPLELQATIPDYTVPFVTVLQRGQPAFGMFDDLPRKYHWALPLLEYNNGQTLLAAFDQKVIAPALAKVEEVRRQKALPPTRRSAED